MSLMIKVRNDDKLQKVDLLPINVSVLKKKDNILHGTFHSENSKS